jgi:predicted permease
MRLAKRRRALVLTAVLNLAVAIGVSTAAFTVVNGLWIRYYLSADASVVDAWRRHQRGASANWPLAELLEVRRHAKLMNLEGEYATIAPFSTSAGAAPESTQIEFVTDSYLQTFRADAAVGRLLGPADDRPGAPPVVVLDHLFWRRQLGGDPAIVGRTVWIAGVAASVVGVAGRDFMDPSGDAPQMWLPLSTVDLLPGVIPATRAPQLGAVGRLGPSVTMNQAQAELASLLTGVGFSPGAPPATGVEVTSRVTAGEVAGVRLVLVGVFSVIALVLVLAAANVSNLLLASAETRRQEMALRLSLGASRARVWRQLTTECALLCAVSGVAGFLLAAWLAPMLVVFMGMEGADTDPDARVFAFVALATTLSAVSAGFAPARQARRGDVLSGLKGSTAPTSQVGGRGRARSTLLAVQAAVSIVLVVTAALFVRALVHLAWMDPGFDVDRLIVVAANRPAAQEAGAEEYWRRAIDRVSGIPGVEGVALATFPPFGTRVGDPDDTFHNATDADYFAATGLRLIRGRTYTPDEVTTRAPVAVISRQIAQRHWGEGDPLGASLDRVIGKVSPVRIIGVVDDAQAVRLHARSTPFIYVPMTSSARAQLVVRARDPRASANIIQDALAAMDSDVQPRISILGDRFARELEAPRRYAVLAAGVAVLALALAVVGLAGATAFSVRCRAKEIGIRVALGARRGDVTRLFVHDAMRPVVVGLGVGLIGALLMGQVIASLLRGMSERDPIALVAAVVVLLLAALSAVRLPLRRAVRLDPAVVLRDS